MPKKKSKKIKKNGKGVGGKADVHVHEEGKRNKSLLGHNAIFTPDCLLYTSPSPRDATLSRMPSSA